MVKILLYDQDWNILFKYMYIFFFFFCINEYMHGQHSPGNSQKAISNKMVPTGLWNLLYKYKQNL